MSGDKKMPAPLTGTQAHKKTTTPSIIIEGEGKKSSGTTGYTKGDARDCGVTVSKPSPRFSSSLVPLRQSPFGNPECRRVERVEGGGRLDTIGNNLTNVLRDEDDSVKGYLGNTQISLHSWCFDFERAAREKRKMEECGRWWVVWTHNLCGAKVATALSCDSRFCVRCAKKRVRRIVEGYRGQLRRPVRHIVLTVPNAQKAEDLPLALYVLVEGFKRLRRRRIWRGKRGLYSVEVTWSRERGFHPHLHILVEWSGWVNYDEVHRVWREITRRLGCEAKHRPDVRFCRDVGGGLREALKYVTKMWCLDDEVKDVLMALFVGRRLVQTFGGLKKREDDGVLVCPRCGAIFVFREWTMEVMSEDEYVWDRMHGTGWGDYYEWVEGEEGIKLFFHRWKRVDLVGGKMYTS